MKPFALALVIITVGCTALDAQEGSPASTPQRDGAALADIMSTTQFRHLKLGYAGQVANWPLAHYEMTLMRQSFDLAARSYPKVGNVPFAQLVKIKSTPALDDIGRAIAARNRQGFALAFQRLTEACNSCHQASGFGFVVMRVPTLSPFSNQVFPPRE
ncbi:MAG: hypothetical protein WCF20_00080 [Methylovirgula sp.]